MSDYYDDGPLQITQWNTLIRDVNEKLENPPGGCGTSTTLDEVTAPHVWSVTDVEDVRTAMEETCPTITFETELKVWKTEIIDEIADQIEDMWCECECADVEFGLVVLSYQFFLAAPHAEHCCGEYVEETPCIVCTGLMFYASIVTGDYYPPLAGINTATWEIICDTYTAGETKLLEFVAAVNAAQRRACLLEKEQLKLDDEILPPLDNAISLYLSTCCGHDPLPTPCSSLVSQISDLGAQATNQQTIIDAAYADFMLEYVKIDPARTACDATAAANMAACMLIQTRYPIDWQGALWALPLILALQFNWWQWFKPENDNIIANEYQLAQNLRDNLCFPNSTANECENNSAGCLKYLGHSGCGIRPSILYEHTKSRTGRTVSGHIRLSPNGTPFLSPSYCKYLMFQLATRYYIETHRTRCDALFEVSCPIVGVCNWFPWSEDKEIHYDGGDQVNSSCAGGCNGFCAWLWGDLGPNGHGEPVTTTETQRLTYHANTARIGQDNSLTRDAWYNDHVDWYVTHPTYDNRHEGYCD